MNPIWNNVRLMMACVQSEDFEHIGHFTSFSTFLIEAGEHIRAGRIFIQRGQTMPLDFARSQLAQAAANPANGFTHMFMYDADMSISLAHIEKLLSRDEAIVSGTYFMAGHQEQTDGETMPFPCVAQRDGRYITRPVIAEAAAADQLIEVHGTGAGCLLVTTDALRTIGNPAFEFKWNVTNGGAAREGEDYFFCRMARSSGLTVYLDPTVQPDHFKFIRVGLILRDMNGAAITTFDR
jgi:hypothetical protein